MGWPFIAPPDLPAERAQALRKAFDDTMKDPEFLAEAKQRLLDVNPMSGADIDKLVSELYQTPPEVIAATKAIIVEECAVARSAPCLRSDRAPHPLGRRRHLDVAHAEIRERIHHRVRDRRHRADAAGLAAALDAERIGLGRHRIALDVDAR